MQHSFSFFRIFILTFLGVVAGICVFLFLLDPDRTLHLSPNLERGPVAQNQRFSYPSIARNQNFDSVIIGTSTTRMIKPARLNRVLEAKFANLSMNSGTWWEQREMTRLFMRHHPQPKYFMVGLDVIWCAPRKAGRKQAGRLFPVWLYDENPWNDYAHLLNFKMLEKAGRQVGVLLGLKRPRYDHNGYRTLNDKGRAYDLGKARRKIYRQTYNKVLKKKVKPTAMLPAKVPPEVGELQRESWPYPNIEILEKMLAKVPEETKIVLIFVPYHRVAQGRPGTRKNIIYEECKRRVMAKFSADNRVQILDFMFRSSFTTQDRNYWDRLHYNDQSAQKIDHLLAEAVTTGKSTSDVLRLLP